MQTNGPLQTATASSSRGLTHGAQVVSHAARPGIIIRARLLKNDPISSHPTHQVHHSSQMYAAKHHRRTMPPPGSFLGRVRAREIAFIVLVGHRVKDGIIHLVTRSGCFCSGDASPPILSLVLPRPTPSPGFCGCSLTENTLAQMIRTLSAP